MKRRSVLALALVACTPAPLAGDSDGSTSTTLGPVAPSTSSTTGTTTDALDDAPAEIDLDVVADGFTLLDLDEDGHIDLVTSAYTAAVQLLRGRGDGSFDAPIGLGDGFNSYASAIVGGDFDGDGARDLAALWSGHVVLLRDPLHGPHEALDTPAAGVALAVADADADGLDDLFLPGANVLLRLHGHASGSFDLRPPLGLGGEPVDIVAADLDADGALDLVTANVGTDDLSLLRGDGLGGFLSQTLLPVGDQPFALAVADLDVDGTLDLVVLHVGGLVTLRGLGGGAFAAPQGIALPEHYGPHGSSFAVCELDGDERPEIVVTRDLSSYGWLTRFEVAADARVREPKVLRSGRGVGRIVCADVDGDDRDDLVFSAFRPGGSPTLRLLRSSP
ncbi:FG-GAP repeat domain-containing protein [Nannocystis punicea]|uniref:VCBS repeat-containing protein n=1 Tax=Nannocystis punicea TaxID=2995304 RepID=A0ABY7HHN9_9BACT|nr:VCBS repeat-containing protein [Nannocystis poenicansa]WAS98826.1 VCBS repeat-containing protein [Nannocystis poenicansa]